MFAIAGDRQGPSGFGGAAPPPFVSDSEAAAAAAELTTDEGVETERPFELSCACCCWLRRHDVGVATAEDALKSAAVTPAADAVRPVSPNRAAAAAGLA